MQCYAVLEPIPLRGKIIRRNVRTSRGRIVTRGGKDKLHWIVLPTKYQVGTDQSQLGY